MRIIKGDKVRIISGKNKGKEGMVEKVYKGQNSLLIPGINLYKKHIRKNEKMPQGGVVEIPRPLASNKVVLICSKCNSATRVEYKVDNKRKTRVCKKCKSTL
jgi:large subunit ribosomal protein L24